MAEMFRVFHLDAVHSRAESRWPAGMQIGHCQYDALTVAWLIKAAAVPDASRSSLVCGVCERLDWRGSSGNLATASVRKALPRVAEALGITLPPSGPGIPPGEAMASLSAPVHMVSTQTMTLCIWCCLSGETVPRSYARHMTTSRVCRLLET